MAIHSISRRKMRRMLWFIHFFVTLVTIGMIWGELFKSHGGSQTRPIATEAVPWGVDLAAIIFLGIVWLTSGLSQKKSIHPVVVISGHVGWLILFTWYGWFSKASPFIVHELHGPNVFTDAENRTLAWQYLQSGAVYCALIAIYDWIPLSFLLRTRRVDAIDRDAHAHWRPEIAILSANVAFFV